MQSIKKTVGIPLVILALLLGLVIVIVVLVLVIGIMLVGFGAMMDVMAFDPGLMNVGKFLLRWTIDLLKTTFHLVVNII